MKHVSHTKISTQQVYEQKYARKKFQEPNHFQKEKKNQCTSFTMRKINTQQVPLTKSVSRGGKSI